jgi:hypothetical protein
MLETSKGRSILALQYQQNGYPSIDVIISNHTS